QAAPHRLGARAARDLAAALFLALKMPRISMNEAIPHPAVPHPVLPPPAVRTGGWWFRRALVFGATVLITASGGLFMGDLLWRLYGSFNGASVVLLGIFLVLFGLLAFGVMTAVSGFFIGGAGGPRINLATGLVAADL